MDNETELMRSVDQCRSAQCRSEYSRLAGRFSAISGYLDAINIPKLSKINKRVKLMAIMFQQLQIENRRLTLLLAENEEDTEGE